MVDLARLDALGLIEVEVPGTSFKLVGLKDRAKEPSLEQRVEMARRLNEVGHKLPRYVKRVDSHPAEQHQKKVEEIVNAAQQGELPMSTKKGTGALPAGVDAKEIEKAHAQSVADAKKRDADAKLEAAKKAKADELKRKQEAAARKKMKGKSVAPSRTPASQAKADKKEAKADAKKKPAAAAPKKSPGGIGGLVVRMLKEKKSTEDILAAVKKEYPKARTSPASIAWYRSKINNGEL